MPIYLPRNLAGLAALTASEQSRYSMSAIRLIDPDNGLYRAEATDGKVLGIIQGPIAPDTNYTILDESDDKAALLIPHDSWQQAFKLGDKRRPVGIGAKGNGLVLAVGDQSITTPEVDGRYPDVDAVLPSRGPLLRIRVNPSLLIDLLKLAVAINPNEGVNLLIFGKGVPLGLATKNDEGQTFDALLMPLTGKE